MPEFLKKPEEEEAMPLDVSWFIKNNKTIPIYEDKGDDVAWLIACTLILYTMNTGIALMESGMCSLKNEVHLLMKNLAASLFGGLAFWAVGWSISTGQGKYANPFMGWGEWFFEPDWLDQEQAMRGLYFFYYGGLNTMGNSIISGSMAERVNFKAFTVFSVLSTLTRAFVMCWLWAPQGWLKQLGALDMAGCAVVHLVGGFSGLMCSIYLGPRKGLKYNMETVIMGNPTNCGTGLFIAWWGYLAMNSASTHGVSSTRWLQTAKATVMATIASFGGGCVAVFLSYIMYKHFMPVGPVLNSMMGPLIATTAVTFLAGSIESCFIGFFSGFIVFLGIGVMDKSEFIDDPCCIFIVHGMCAVWGMISAGLFAQEDTISKGFSFNTNNGFLHGGNYLIFVQILATVVIIAWSMGTTYIFLRIVNFFIPMRGDLVSEILGGDLMEHNILHLDIGIEEQLEKLKTMNMELEDTTFTDDPHYLYFYKAWDKSGLGKIMGAQKKSRMSIDERRPITAEDMSDLAYAMGVESITKDQFNKFRTELNDLEPRQDYGFGTMGKKVYYLNKKNI